MSPSTQPSLIPALNNELPLRLHKVLWGKKGHILHLPITISVLTVSTPSGMLSSSSSPTYLLKAQLKCYNIHENFTDLFNWTSPPQLNLLAYSTTFIQLLYANLCYITCEYKLFRLRNHKLLESRDNLFCISPNLSVYY